MTNLSHIAFESLHPSLRSVVEDTFMYDFYRTADPHDAGIDWQIAWNALRKRGAIVRASVSPIVKVRWVDCASPDDALAVYLKGDA